MENKQTAVEWLVEQLECFGNKHELQMSWATLDELFQQAKAMETKQIKDAYVGYNDDEFGLLMNIKDMAEQYYNETYGN
jgi:hypothetical protein